MKPQITKYENGNIKTIAYINDVGKYHRTDGPARIRYYTNDIYTNEWYINGKKHKTDGPAFIEYYPNGNIRYKSWWINGKRHNDINPATILYNENGKPDDITITYWINGEQLSKQEFTILNRKRKLKIINETTNN